MGALLPLVTPGAGFKIMLKSDTEMAADRLCACPRRPAGGPRAACGSGNALSLFVGLVDKISPFPVLPSPPMNSETFRWCIELGLGGIVRGEDGPWEPKLKAGKASHSFCRPISTAETGLRPVALENDEGAEEDMGFLAGNWKSGKGRGPGLFSRGDN